MLAIICAFYALDQYSKSGVTITSNATSISGVENHQRKADNNFLNDIVVENISKLSNYTNYSNEGRREEYIFTGELVNKF